MSKLTSLEKDPKLMTLELLAKVWGVGPQAAQKLYSKGIKTIEQLRKKEDLLTSMQKIGLKYFEDFEERIPRAEATEISTTV